MKTRSLLFFVWLLPAVVFSQSLSPTVIASAGATASAGGVTLDWTLGEIATETYSNGGYTLTQGFHQPLMLEITVNLKAFLQGPWNGSNMNTTLNPSLPLSQPYHPSLPYYGNANPKWYYGGSELVAAIPNVNVVDWILVELRDAPSAAAATTATAIAQKAVFLLKNGTVTGLDGASMLKFPVTISQNLYVVLYHRNHLGIMSANAVTKVGGVYTYNFSTSSAQVYGGSLGHKQLASGVWGMTSSDGNADGQVSSLDKNDVWRVLTGLSGYYAGDFNMDLQVNTLDKNDHWSPNSGSGSQIPN